MTRDTPPVACTIAGTDSGGSAGLAADLKTFAAHRVHGVFAVTVVTAQNSTGIKAVETLPSALVGGQIDAVASDFTIGATKTGLLFSRENVEVVADRASALGPLVVDPVLVTSAGEPMLANDVSTAYVDLLFPLAAVITPNVFEAALLTGVDIADTASATEAASRLLDFGPAAVVITGLLTGDRAVDVIASHDGVVVRDRERIDTMNVLGTGCSLSAATAARLASGESMTAAIGAAGDFVHRGLRSGANWKLGEGRGPIDHFIPSSEPHDD
jgi:hydroxymethylpyrimidine/phosphomethylpyrimidine kinase